MQEGSRINRQLYVGILPAAGAAFAEPPRIEGRIPCNCGIEIKGLAANRTGTPAAEQILIPVRVFRPVYGFSGSYRNCF